MAIMGLVFGLNALLVKKMNVWNEDLMKLKDEKVRAVKELLTNMKIFKIYN